MCGCRTVPSEERHNVDDYVRLNDPDAAETFGARLWGLAVMFKTFNQPPCSAASGLRTRGWLAAEYRRYRWRHQRSFFDIPLFEFLSDVHELDG